MNKLNAAVKVMYVVVAVLFLFVLCHNTDAQTLTSNDTLIQLKTQAKAARTHLDKLQYSNKEVSTADLYKAQQALSQAQCAVYMFIAKTDPDQAALAVKQAQEHRRKASACAAKLVEIFQ